MYAADVVMLPDLAIVLTNVAEFGEVAEYSDMPRI